jgi:hypothetical protein
MRLSLYGTKAVTIRISDGPEGETLGEFEMRMESFLRAAQEAAGGDLPDKMIQYTRDEARKARLYRNTKWE